MVAGVGFEPTAFEQNQEQLAPFTPFLPFLPKPVHEHDMIHYYSIQSVMPACYIQPKAGNIHHGSCLPFSCLI
jgi:hypothetical protein